MKSWRYAALAIGLPGLMCAAIPAHGGQGAASAGPIAIERQGSFAAGGAIAGQAGQSTLHCDHGFVEYQIPVAARQTGLFLWHSSSTAVWQNNWAGGPGFQSIFLSQGFAVYMWDGPRVGRANWGCSDYEYRAVPGRDQQNFTSWRLGAQWMEWFPGIQFPADDPAALNQALRGRYDEFDTLPNARLEAATAAQALDRIGPVVLVTSSAGGMRALLAATQSENVAAIVAYENPGYPFPPGTGPQRAEGPFGPVNVTDEEFAALAKIPMQFVWGDNLDKSPLWAAQFEQCRQFVELLNARGGNAEILRLPEIGIRGNTHMPFADLNNGAVAQQLSRFLQEHGLDRR